MAHLCMYQYVISFWAFCNSHIFFPLIVSSNLNDNSNNNIVYYLLMLGKLMTIIVSVCKC